MEAKPPGAVRSLVIVVVCAGLGLASILYWGAPDASHVQRQVEKQRSREFQETVVAELDPLSRKAAEYISAVQAGDCDGIVSRTVWMQERLARMRDEGADAGAIAAESTTLCASLAERTADGYALQSEGIGDQYLFFPGVEFEYVGKDAGRDNLAGPVATRAWFALEFPSPMRCIKDPAGRSVSGVTVGINVMADGTVLKANVVGNVEINTDSLRYTW